VHVITFQGICTQWLLSSGIATAFGTHEWLLSCNPLFRFSWVDVTNWHKITRKSIRPKESRTMPMPGLQSNFGVWWPWLSTIWPPKLNVSSPCPAIYLHKFAAKSAQRFTKYRGHKFGRTNGQIENIVPSASLESRRAEAWKCFLIWANITCLFSLLRQCTNVGYNKKVSQHIKVAKTPPFTLHHNYIIIYISSQFFHVHVCSRPLASEVLSRDAMHKRGLCLHAMSCLSVCVCHVRWSC